MSQQFMQILARALGANNLGWNPDMVGTPGINGNAPDPRLKLDPRGPVPLGGQQAVPFPLNFGIDAIAKDLPNIISGMSNVPKWEQERNSRTQQAYAPPTIKPRSPVSGRDALPMALIAGLSALLGADENDLAQGLQGFVGARQGIVDQEFQLAQQADTLRRQGLLNEAGIFGEKISGAEKAKADNDKWLRELKVLDTKNEATAKEKELDRQSRESIATGKDRVSAIKGLLAKATPEGRSLLAGQLGIDDPGVIEALRQLNESEKNLAAKTQTENEMRPGKVTAQELKNEYQGLVNKYYPQLSDAKLKLSDEQVKYLQVKRENYPKYLQLALEKLHVSQALAANTIGNTEFDNSIKAWDAQTKGTITALETEMQGHLKRREAVIKQMDEATKAGEDTGDMGEQLSRLNTRIKAIKEQLQSIGDTAPTVGPPTGATEPPPGGFGQISVDQITIPSVTMGGAAPPSKREIGGRTMGAPNGNARKTTTTKQPAKTQKVGDKLKGTGKFTFGGKKK